MIATLAFLSLVANLNTLGMQGAQVSEFPKPQLQNPSFQFNRKLFQYLPSGELTESNPFVTPLDWSESKIPVLVPGAPKLLVKIIVLERDYSDLNRIFSLEDRDKQRFLQACFRLPSAMKLVTQGNADVEIVPQFVPDSVFNAGEVLAGLNKDINSAKFDADDSVVRGPFDAVISIHAGELPPFGAQGAELENYLVEKVIGSVRDQVSEKLRQAGSMAESEDLPSLLKLGISNRSDAIGITDWFKKQDTFQPFAPSVKPSVKAKQVCFDGAAKVSTGDGDTLEYSEESILRSGKIAVPPLPFATTLKFEYKANSPSPVAFIQGDKEFVVADAGGKTTADDTWHEGFVNLDAGSFSIGAPSILIGTNRTNSRLVKYSFRNFSAVRGVSISGGLVTSSNPATKLKEIALGNAPVGAESRPALVSDSLSIYAPVAFYSVLAYGKTVSATEDLEAKTFIQGLLRAASNESAREAALLVVADHPELGTFELVSPNLIRKSWRVRLAATKAMGALGKTEFKARPASRELLLSASFQDYASIRSVALSYLDPKVANEKKRLEYGVLNDTSESVRLQCLATLLKVSDQSKDVLLGSLADESWLVRTNAPGLYMLANRSDLAREAGQRLVVDQDPYVRATALKFLAENFKDVQLGEIQSSFIDEHPAVQFSLVTGAKLSGWQLPKETIAMLKKSVSKGVRNLAESL